MHKFGLMLLATLWLAGGAVSGAEAKAPLKYSAEELKLAERTMEAMGMPKQFEDMIGLMLDMQCKANPMMIPYRPVMETFFRKHMSYPVLKNDLAVIYAETFTGPELKELAELFASPIGRKFVANSAELSRRGAELGQARVQQNMGELVQLLQAEQQKQQTVPVLKK